MRLTMNAVPSRLMMLLFGMLTVTPAVRWSVCSVESVTGSMMSSSLICGSLLNHSCKSRAGDNTLPSGITPNGEDKNYL